MVQDRRAFLKEGFKVLGRIVADAVQETITDAAGGRRYLRPPGALDEAAFLLACTRCGDCAAACPTGAIRLLDPWAGLAAGTPYLDPLERACDLCGKCMPVCSPAALTIVQDPGQVRMGTAVIYPEHCWAYQGRICSLCYQHCPFPDVAIRLEAGRPAIIPDGCTGCGQCAHVCVSTPVAIRVQPK